MSNLTRGPSIDALIKFRFIWLSGFRGEEFLEVDQPEKRIVYGGHVCERIRTKLSILVEDLP